MSTRDLIKWCNNHGLWHDSNELYNISLSRRQQAQSALIPNFWPLVSRLLWPVDPQRADQTAGIFIQHFAVRLAVYFRFSPDHSVFLSTSILSFIIWNFHKSLTDAIWYISSERHMLQYVRKKIFIIYTSKMQESKTVKKTNRLYLNRYSQSRRMIKFSRTCLSTGHW